METYPAFIRRIARLNTADVIFGRAANEGPLRTQPESEPGHGGCPAINPRHSDPSWRRWRCAAGRRVERWGAINRRDGVCWPYRAEDR